MDRVFDKSIILIACAASLLFAPFNTFLVVAFLVAIVIAFLSEITVISPILSTSSVGLYLVLALFLPEFALFIPLVSYDYLRKDSWVFRLIWLIPFSLGLRFFELGSVLFAIAIAVIMVFLSLRTLNIEHEIGSYIALRDELREESIALEQKNRNLRDRQDMEVHLATLNERGRIAREIHDNVGHLLTRSVLQVEAFQVIHAHDAQIHEEFEEVGTTVHEALNTVRESVHNLHDDAFDLEMQLKRTIKDCSELDTHLEYLVENIPSLVGYCFIALTREAISNTLKHSNADTMRISVLEQPGFYRLTLSDNGELAHSSSQQQSSYRMRPENENNPLKGGIGLRTMEERVRNLNGFFRIDSNDGFCIVASIPKQEIGE